MMSVGMPAFILLHQFGRIVYDAFGNWPYLVGSAAIEKDWRDVDVRLILEDTIYHQMFGDLLPSVSNHKWAALCLAFATLGKGITGLPIDFQIQPQTWANEQFPGRREALILYADIFSSAKES